MSEPSPPTDHIKVCGRCSYTRTAHADGRFGLLCPDGSGWCWAEPTPPTEQRELQEQVLALRRHDCDDITGECGHYVNVHEVVALIGAAMPEPTPPTCPECGQERGWYAPCGTCGSDAPRTVAPPTDQPRAWTHGSPPMRDQPPTDPGLTSDQQGLTRGGSAPMRDTP
jgi:hypothetical protein